MTPDKDLSARLPLMGKRLRIAALHDAYIDGQLVTLAHHEAAVQAAVAKAVEAERARHQDIRMKLDSRIRNQRRELSFWNICFNDHVWSVFKSKGIANSSDLAEIRALGLGRLRRAAAIRSRGVAP